MPEPVVTIIIPTYRRLQFLPEAISSALNQTFRDFEIIVADDGNSAEIAHIAAEFKDPRIRYSGNARRLDIAMNHAAAFKQARGRYLASLHDDDVWEPTFLAELVPPLEKDASLSVAFCDHYLIDEQGRFSGARTESNSRTYGRDKLAAGRHQPFLEMAVVHQSIPMAMAAVFRKSILDQAEYPARIGGSYDHWLAYLVTKDNHAAYYIPKRLTRYRVHSHSGSLQRGTRNLRDSIYVRTRFLQEPSLAPWHKSIANSLGIFYGKLALLLLDKKDYRRAWIMAKHAIGLMNRPKNMAGLVKNYATHFLASIRK